MRDLLLYVEDNLLFSPERCFEDESVLSQKNQASEDDPKDDPLILLKSSLLDKSLIAPPPGFTVPGKPITLETIMEEQIQSSLTNTAANNVPPVNIGTNTNPFVQESVHLTTDKKLTTQVLMDLYNINVQLQTYIQALHTLLSTSGNNQCAIDGVKSAVNALVNNALLDSVSRSKGQINTFTEEKSIINGKCTSVGPTDYLYKDILNNLTVPNGTSFNLDESSARVPKVNNACYVSSDINNHYRETNKSVSINSGSDSSNSPLNNYSNGIPAMLNYFEQGRIPASISYVNLSESVHTVAESFNKLSVTESRTSAYSTPPTDTLLGYLNRESQESVQFAEPSSVTMNTYNSAYRNDSTNHTINSFEPLNNNVIGYKETNPFKLSLAGKLQIPDSNEQQYQSVQNYGIPQPTVSSCPNAAAPKYSYQPHAAETSTVDISNIYSPNLPHNANGENHVTAAPKQEATYYPSAIGTNNVWSAGYKDSHTFNGFIPDNPMYILIPKETRAASKEVTPDVCASNTYARNNVMNDYSNQNIFQEPTCRPIVDCSTNIFSSGKYDDMNTEKQHVNFDSGRLFEVPHTCFDRRPSQEEPVARDFDIKVPPSRCTRRICLKSVLDGNCGHIDSTGSSWSPITGFTSPLLMENIDEGYQTRPSTSTTLQASPPSVQTFSDTECKRQFTTGESNIVNNTCIDTPSQLFGNTTAWKFETKKTENLPRTFPNTCQNGTNEAHLVSSESPSNFKNINNEPLNKIQVYNCGGNLLCRQIELRGSYVSIFHYRGEGWILMNDFVDVFTEFKSPSIIISVCHVLGLSIESLPLEKFNFSKIPQFDSKMKRMALDNDGNSYARVHLIPLNSAIKALRKLNIMTQEEINKASTKRGFADGGITHQLWAVITAYGGLLRVIDNC